ncbi:unnamed protein product [Euphydryas editha]|uniref:Uncharacterized protein n=1 Tax=Euphydryas editha TaxID=104508 RepID=A0AAU9URW8_EUPED|nr:unnamed protein product [Euphydryas editha]
MSCHSNPDIIDCSSESCDSNVILQLEEPGKACIAINDDVLIREHVNENIQYYLAQIESIEELYYTCYLPSTEKNMVEDLPKPIIKTPPIQLIETQSN